MNLRQNYTKKNTDAEETQFVPVDDVISSKKSTDKYDTHEINRKEIYNQEKIIQNNINYNSNKRQYNTTSNPNNENTAYQYPNYESSSNSINQNDYEEPIYRTPPSIGTHSGTSPYQRPVSSQNSETNCYQNQNYDRLQRNNTPQSQYIQKPHSNSQYNNNSYSQSDIYNNYPSQRQHSPQRQTSQNQNHQRQISPPSQQRPDYQRRNPQQSQRQTYNNEREYNSDMPSTRSKPQHQTSSSYEKRQPKNRQPEPKRTPQKQKSYYTKKAKRQRNINFGSVIRFILKLIIILFVLYSVIALIGIFTMDKQKTGERNRTDDAMSASYVDNILIIGTDSRDLTEDSGRSDSMILLSLNSNTNEIYMTSFLRDVYVDINNYGSGKLNAAYSYGGAELLMDTIESNYNIKIDDYVTVSFAACANIIDAVGGVELELSDDEADAVNEILISEVNELMGDGREDDLLSEGGTQKLNGKQALSYSRIRYVGNADFERTSRQRVVMSQVMKKASKNPVSLCRILFSALPEMSTNMSIFKLYGYSFRAPIALLFDDIIQQRIPADDTFHSDTRDGEDVLITTFEENQLILKNTIFKKN